MYSDLRRLLASLDFRFALVIEDAPDGFGSYRAAPEVRSPIELVRHMCHLVEMMQRQFGSLGGEGGTEQQSDFDAECRRFRRQLRTLDEDLAAGPPFEPDREGMDYQALLQGPLADALTHVGQLALLRRLAGSPVERVSYWRTPMALPAENELER